MLMRVDYDLCEFLRIFGYGPPMDNKRTAPRHRVLKAGTIEFGGGGISCTVRNLSASGAALDVESPLERFPIRLARILRLRSNWRIRAA